MVFCRFISTGLPMDTLSKRIEYLLEKGFLTKKELARYLEIPLSTLLPIVAGKKKPELNVAILIAEYFGVSVDWLLTGRGHIKRHEEYNISSNELLVNQTEGNKLKFDLSDSIKLPTGEKIDERREDFRSPFIKEILGLIKKLSPDQRKKALKIIRLTFDLESN